MGTSSARPTPRRNCSAVGLVYGGETILFDCGEGTQLQAVKAGFKTSKLSALCITHFHGDHINGLPGFLGTMGLNGHRSPLVLAAPPGIRKYLATLRKLHILHPGFPIEVVHADEGVVVERPTYRITTCPLDHRMPTWGYMFEEFDLPGRFDLDRARELGLKPGPIFGRLQRGESVTTDDGRVVHPEDVLGPSRRGRKIAYMCDTRPSPTVVDFVREADVLIHDSTYLDEHRDDAYERGHSTCVEAAEVARLAEVGELVLTHLSPKHTRSKDFTDQASKVFEPVRVAEDFLEIDLLGRAVKDASISYSSDGITYEHYSNVVLTRVTPDNIALDVSDTVPLEVDARFVKIEINSNYNGKDYNDPESDDTFGNYTGLAEVRFQLRPNVFRVDVAGGGVEEGVTASSNWPGRTPQNAKDGSFDGVSSMWLTGASDEDPHIIFDLGSVWSLTEMDVWNYAEYLPLRDDLLGRSAKNVTISYSTSGDGPFNELSTLDLSAATPDNISQGVMDTIPLMVDAQRIKIEINSNYNGKDYDDPDSDDTFGNLTGLAEVQFRANGQPSVAFDSPFIYLGELGTGSFISWGGNFLTSPHTPIAKAENPTDVTNEDLFELVGDRKIRQGEMGAVVGRLQWNHPFRDAVGVYVHDERFEVVAGQLKLRDDMTLIDVNGNGIELDLDLTFTDDQGLHYENSFVVFADTPPEAPVLRDVSFLTASEGEDKTAAGNTIRGDVAFVEWEEHASGALDYNLQVLAPNGALVADLEFHSLDEGARHEACSREQFTTGCIAVVPGLEFETDYTFKLRANSEVGYGEFATRVETSRIAPPSDVRKLKAESSSPDTVELSWLDTDRETLWEIDHVERTVVVDDDGLETVSLEYITSVASIESETATGYLISGLAPNTTYTYEVTARNGSGSSSSFVTVTTQPRSTTDVTGVVVESRSLNRAEVTWTDAENEAIYRVYGRAEGETEDREFAVVGADVTSVVVEGLTPGGTYTFFVEAANSVGSTRSEEVSYQHDGDVTRLPGDANEDGTVGFADFAALAANFGKAEDAVWADGDFNGDGRVGFADFAALAANFGRKIGV